jgi:hypothetical protein
LITLYPSTLTFFLDRLFSNLVKMIKVGRITRTRNVITAFLSLALGAPSHKIDIWPGAYVRNFLGLAGNGRAIELEADLGFHHDDSVRSQI